MKRKEKILRWAFSLQAKFHQFISRYITLYSWLVMVLSAMFSDKSDLHIGLLRIGRKNRPGGFPARADEIENNPCLLPVDSILASATSGEPLANVKSYIPFDSMVEVHPSRFACCLLPLFSAVFPASSVARI